MRWLRVLMLVPRPPKPWWMFWHPMSGLPGGLVGGAILFLTVLAYLALAGCGVAQVQVCRFAKLDDQPVIVCVPGTAEERDRVRPYQPAPSPSLPERENHIGPYWRYDGRDRDVNSTEAWEL